jgi:chromosomal replication initiation ATPase DnaA
MSYPEIGRVMQGRHHTTVMHGVREAREAEKQVASMRVIKAVDDAVCE